MNDSIFLNDLLATTKQANLAELCTKDEFEARIKAIAKSLRDIVWWAEHFFRIVSLNTGLGVIKLYEKLKLLLRYLVDNDRIVLLSSRQTGKTTTYTVFCMWMATLFAEKKIMICANKLQTAIEIMDRLRIAYEYLPSWIKPGITVYNKGEISFANKSSIRAVATSSSASRGFSALCVCIDEMAFIPKNIMQEFFASVMPVVSSAKDSKVIAVSTPNGTSGLYYDIWKAANSKDVKTNKEGWKPFRIDWWEVPGRTEDWKQKQIASIGIDKWNQEFGNEFIASSTMLKLIPDDIIEKFRMKQSEMKLTKVLDGKTQTIQSQDKTLTFEFTMWHEFKSDRTYLASADVAEGTGGDASVLYIWDVTDLSDIKLCCKFESSSASTIEFAFITVRLLLLYGNPWLACESNGVGAGYLDALRVTYGYENIVREGKDNKYGITSHVQVKGKACLWLREMFTTCGLGWTLYDKDLVEEMGTFVKKDAKVHVVYNAMFGAHDDHIMALCWAAWILCPEVVETYFRVVKTFTTSLEKIVPMRLEPYDEYTVDTIKHVTDDPLYQKFLQYKDEMLCLLKSVYDKQLNCKREAEAKGTVSFDLLFFGDNGGGDCWGNPYMPYKQTLYELTAQSALGVKKPMFFINN